MSGILTGDYGGYSNSQSEPFDNALICENGHIINDFANQYPEDNSKFCEKCGKIVLSKCSKCSTLFKGNRIGYTYKLPLFCFNCGDMFPWTLLKIESAIEIGISSDIINDSDKEIIKSSIPEIIKDTPRTILESTKLLKVLKKIGNGTANMVKDIIVEIASETAKKIIWQENK